MVYKETVFSWMIGNWEFLNARWLNKRRLPSVTNHIRPRFIVVHFRLFVLPTVIVIRGWFYSRSLKNVICDLKVHFLISFFFFFHRIFFLLLFFHVYFLFFYFYFPLFIFFIIFIFIYLFFLFSFIFFIFFYIIFSIFLLLLVKRKFIIRIIFLNRIICRFSKNKLTMFIEEFFFFK